MHPSRIRTDVPRPLNGLHAASAAVLLCAGLIAPAAAQAQAPGTDHAWFFRGGAFFPNIDTQVRADGRNGLVGTSIDFESDLGLDDSKTLGIFDVAWRFLPKHRVEFNYLDLSRNASSTLRATINWQGQVYEVDTRVRGEFESRITALSYVYSFYRTPEAELEAGIGLHGAKLTAGLSVEGTTISESRTASANAPLPVIVLRGATRFTDQWSGELRYQWFGIQSGDYDGSLNVLNASVAYRPWKNFGIEAGYNYSRYDLEVQRESWTGEAKYVFRGPVIALVASF